MATCAITATGINGPFIQPTNTAPDSCAEFILLSKTDWDVYNAVITTAPAQPTAADVLYVTSWGFGVVIFFWSLGFALGIALDMIRKA